MIAWCINLMVSALVAVVSVVPTLAAWTATTQDAAPETLTRRLSWSGTQTSRALQVSNLHGDIRIVAEDRVDVAVTATRVIERQVAGDPAPQPDFRQESAGLLVCGDSSHCGCHLERTDERQYERRERTRVRVDLELRVPKLVTLDVCGVNGGQVRIDGTDGPFTVRNVNGAIRMVGVRGAGSVTTVNGSVQASFTAPPASPSTFRTVNGTVDVTMPPSLAADLHLTTRNGGLYTDFDTTTLPTQMARRERKGGRVLYRADRFTSVRVGRGGPELTFETLNGDVRVRKANP